jgi:hypothetical protein
LLGSELLVLGASPDFRPSLSAAASAFLLGILLLAGRNPRVWAVGRAYKPPESAGKAQGRRAGKWRLA